MTVARAPVGKADSTGSGAWQVVHDMAFDGIDADERFRRVTA
jgi:hypothetical protein